MTPNKITILITGSQGMVGRNLAQTLQEHYHLLTPPRNTLDLLDRQAVDAYLNDHKPDIIVHCAGKVGGIQANIAEPTKFLTDNTQMGQNIILAARDAGIERLLNLGSSCMYPKDQDTPLSEAELLSGYLEPTNEGYALAKIHNAKLCEYISREDSRFLYKTIIPCNLYGPHDSFDPKKSHLIPAAILKTHIAKQNDQPNIEVWGDGNARREFMFVGDLCEFILSALPKISSLPDYINVGLGYDYSINEYYEAICKVIGYTGALQHNLDKPVGMKRKLLNVASAKNWGWKAPTNLEEGISMTYQYYLDYEKK